MKINITRIEKRLQALESIKRFDSGIRHVGKYFDELTEQEQLEYLQYYDGKEYPLLDIDMFKKLHEFIDGTTHIVCVKRPEPDNRPLSEKIADVEAFMEEGII